MPIVQSHEPNPSLEAALAFLAGQQQHAQQIQAQQQQAAEQAAREQQASLAQRQAAIQQQQQALAQQPRPGAALAAADPQQQAAVAQPAANQRFQPDPRAGSARAAAGLAFLTSQSHDAAAVAAQQNQSSTQQAIAERQAAHDAFAAQQQQANQLAIMQREQEQAELQANLQQRNKLMQNAPGILDPDQIANAQSRIAANQDALSAPGREELQKLRDAITTGDPAAIQEGMRRGLLAFSPEQQTRVRQVREAMAQVDMDQTLSPAQRAMAQRQLAERLNAIRPMEVPSDQQPKSAIDQFHQDTMVVPHPTLGIPITWQRSVSRNGTQEWVETKSSMEDIKAEHERRGKQWDIDHGVSPNKILEARNHAAIDALKAHKPDVKQFTRQDKDGLPVVDYEGYQKAMVEWASKFDALANQFYADAGGQPGANPATSGGDPGPDPTWDSGQPMDATPATPLASDSQTGMQQWAAVPIRGITTLPDGSVVRKTGPTSFERVQ